MINCANDITNIYYINLDKRVDRKYHVENQLKLLNWNGIRFPAIQHSFSELGCALSHLALLKYARRNNLSHILIMEDDVTFLEPSVFLNSLNKFLETHKEFDVLLLAGNNMGDYKRMDEYCVKVTHCQTTTAYLVKRHYYDTLINNYENGINLLQLYQNKKLLYTIDQYWCSLQLIHNWFLLTPLTVIQIPNMSDIEKRITDYREQMLDLDKIEFVKRQQELVALGVLKIPQNYHNNK
jgi:GR25 family glycosyltransferase involved in LPS biosynthesis